MFKRIFSVYSDRFGEHQKQETQDTAFTVQEALLRERYRPLCKIAEGGFGSVWLVVREALLIHTSNEQPDARWSKPFAVKVLKIQRAQDNQVRDLFIQEARLLAQLEHDNIIEVSDSFCQGPYLALVMKYVDGIVLSNLISHRNRQQRGGISILNAIAIIAQVARGLHYAHHFTNHRGQAMKLLHCDIKPSNIILGMDGRVRILDFGIAETRKEQVKEPSLIMGTPWYMSPEQARNETLTTASDVYSLGMVLYELLTGISLIHAPDAETALHMASTLDSRNTVQALSTRSPELAALLTSMLHPDPRLRQNSAGQIACQLDAILAHQLNKPTLKLYISEERQNLRLNAPDLCPPELKRELETISVSNFSSAPQVDGNPVKKRRKIVYLLASVGSLFVMGFLGENLVDSMRRPRITAPSSSARILPESKGSVLPQIALPSISSDQTLPPPKGSSSQIEAPGNQNTSPLEKASGSMPGRSAQNTPLVSRKPNAGPNASKTASAERSCKNYLVTGAARAGVLSINGKPRPEDVKIYCQDEAIKTIGRSFVYDLAPGPYRLTYRRDGVLIDMLIEVKEARKCVISAQNTPQNCSL